jgi:hypothetical protein
VGISSVWYEGNPCNMHLLDLAAEVKAGVVEAGMVGFRFNTIGVSDAISMGTPGMGYSLQSRDLIADSVETVMGAQVCSASCGACMRMLQCGICVLKSVLPYLEYIHGAPGCPPPQHICQAVLGPEGMHTHALHSPACIWNLPPTCSYPQRGRSCGVW